MKHRLIAVILVTVLLCLFLGNIIACISTTNYTLTITSTAGGTVTTPGVGTFTYDEGVNVTLAATPDVNCHFINWTGNGTVANVYAANTTITMNGDYSITANFVKQYNLTTNSTGGGSVTTPGEGVFTYDEGTVVDLEAEADMCYEFINWTGYVDTIADVHVASTNITMNGDYAIVANFLYPTGLKVFIDGQTNLYAVYGGNHAPIDIDDAESIRTAPEKHGYLLLGIARATAEFNGIYNCYLIKARFAGNPVTIDALQLLGISMYYWGWHYASYSASENYTGTYTYNVKDLDKLEGPPDGHSARLLADEHHPGKPSILLSGVCWALPPG